MTTFQIFKKYWRLIPGFYSFPIWFLYILTSKFDQIELNKIDMFGLL